MWFNLRILVANEVLPLCCWLARARGFRTKVFYEWLEGIGLTKVQLDRVNFKPNSTHSTRESEWTKVWAIFNLNTCWCSSNRLELGLIFREKGYSHYSLDYSIIFRYLVIVRITHLQILSKNRITSQEPVSLLHFTLFVVALVESLNQNPIHLIFVSPHDM